ncbi:hypothetical protein DTO166G4_8990 [Paecilomyces variotii]|nr:hypothetical protein DTO166G4_8990 [Paecilomyces variotii]KAJ9229212.1 hypothetical protein DTO166G5_8063 [Paecilomyces variotii]KAJ9237097.1 hypothetical protein DTO169E5_5292 [Paecilomyces variotii]KAJ9252327.1 hypothetical protein DTO195F2_7520 [Paecilomyces variotii]KAJ9261144.1 hypothetical protein DTO207G8_294 [Paecilomyces variotii]
MPERDIPQSGWLSQLSTPVSLITGGLQEPDLGFVWFGAHADFDTPDETISGYLGGMGVSMLVGKGWKTLLETLLETILGFLPITLARVVYCGVRVLSDAQRSRLENCPAGAVYGHKDIQFDFVNELDQESQKASLRSAAIHLGIDCLDTTPGKANEYASPGRLSSDDISRCDGLGDILYYPVT